MSSKQIVWNKEQKKSTANQSNKYECSCTKSMDWWNAAAAAHTDQCFQLLCVYSLGCGNFLCEMTSWLPSCDVKLNPTPSIGTYLLAEHFAKFHPTPIWNNGALGFFEDGHPNKNKNKIISNRRSVPDLQIHLSISSMPAALLQYFHILEHVKCRTTNIQLQCTCGLQPSLTLNVLWQCFLKVLITTQTWRVNKKAQFCKTGPTKKAQFCKTGPSTHGMLVC